MAIDQTVLTRMMTTAWKDLDGLTKQLASVDSDIARWTEDDVLYKAMRAQNKSDLEAELGVKVAWFDANSPSGAPHVVIYGGTYNVSNISNWRIRTDGGADAYIYLGIGWDGDAIIIKAIDDWAIIKPLIDGSPFGTTAMLANLNAGRAIVSGRKIEIQNRNPILGDYLTFTITASVIGGNGSISPSGDAVLESGRDQTFNMIPDGGYVVDDIIVDATSQEGLLGCGCNLTCYGQSSCGCNVAIYDCPCFATCYGQCSCNATCYSVGGCKGDVGCLCNSTCYGYVLCSCNMAIDACACYHTCYGDACSCNATCYNESNTVYTFTNVVENHTIAVKFRV